MRSNFVRSVARRSVQACRSGTLPIVIICLALIATGCQDNGQLTNDMAILAIKEGVTSPDAVTAVIGIREIPEQNAAEVEFQFTELRYEYFDTIWGKGETTYTGPATAIFHKFNDGRWVLDKISFKNPKINSWARPLGIMQE